MVTNVGLIIVISVLCVISALFLLYMIKSTRDKIYMIAFGYVAIGVISIILINALRDQPCCMDISKYTWFFVYISGGIVIALYGLARTRFPYPDLSESTLMQKARDQYFHGDNAKAVRTLQQLIAKSPRNPNAKYALGRILSEQGKSRSALKHLLFAHELLPDSIEISLELGLTFQKLNKFPDALNVYQQVLGQQASNVEASEQMAICQKKINSRNDARND